MKFVLCYQPKINMRTGAIADAEAPIRWHNPERGLLSPLQFLPVIERHPLSAGLGEWVIDTALEQITAWHSSGLRLSVRSSLRKRNLRITE